MTIEPKTPWYDKKGWVVFWFIFFFPVGIYGLIKSTTISPIWKMVVIILIAIIIFAPRTNNNSASTARTNSNTLVDTVDTAVPELPTDKPEVKPTENRAQAKIACNAWLQEATLIISDLQAGEISRAKARHNKMFEGDICDTQTYIVLGMAINNYEENEINKAERDIRIALSRMNEIAQKYK
jgi:hypothetical protein